MPKETFLNLPEEKRQVIIEAAIEEFAAQPYGRASLSKIVAKAKIAKGSIYQYFENKRGLYLYILEMVYRHKKQFLAEVFEDTSDFFATLKRYYKRSYLFAKEYPLYHSIITHYWEQDGNEFEQEIEISRDSRAIDFIDLLLTAIDCGQVKEDIHQEAAFFVYHSVGKELIDNFLELSETGSLEHLEFIEAVLDVLAEGLQSREEKK